MKRKRRKERVASMREIGNEYKFLVIKLEWKRTLDRPKRNGMRWNDNIKMYLIENVSWLFQDRNQWPLFHMDSITSGNVPTS